MITSIVVTGEYNIGMNSNKKICIDGNTLSVEKDIPFIRYRLDNYTESTLSYIEKTMAQFSLSTHLAEIKLDSNSFNVLTMLSNKFSNLAKYIYVDITEEEVLNKLLSEDKVLLLSQLTSFKIDRLMLKDKSTSLDTVTARAIIKQLSSRLGYQENNIGVCSSPLSFSELACLTAVKARELMSIYSSVADVALPSANHQCMNCCGCIRYMTVNSDVVAPADPKPFGASKKEAKPKNDSDDTSATKEKAVSKPKVKNVVTPCAYNL